MTVAAPREHHVPQERLRRPGQQAAAKFAEDRRIEPGGRELQAQDVLPSYTATSRFRCLAIRPPFSEWQDRHERELPGGAGPIVRAWERAPARRHPRTTPHSSASRRYLCAWGNAAWATRAVSGGRAQPASAEAWYTSSNRLLSFPRLLIGIGKGLAASPLPPHRTFGSLIRRCGSWRQGASSPPPERPLPVCQPRVHPRGRPWPDPLPDAVSLLHHRPRLASTVRACPPLPVVRCRRLTVVGRSGRLAPPSVLRRTPHSSPVVSGQTCRAEPPD